MDLLFSKSLVFFLLSSGWKRVQVKPHIMDQDVYQTLFAFPIHQIVGKEARFHSFDYAISSKYFPNF